MTQQKRRKKLVSKWVPLRLPISSGPEIFIRNLGFCCTSLTLEGISAGGGGGDVEGGGWGSI